MHYHLEVIMPPTKDIALALKNILEQFDESHKDEDGQYPRHSFFDWFQIGGRWSGQKIVAQFSEEKMQSFYDELTLNNVTVSGVQWGKQELSPKSQIPLVDGIWQKCFPQGGKICPMFQHYGQKGGKDIDVCELKDIPELLMASRVIVAGPSFDDENRFEAKYMVSQEFWNGVSHIDTKWDGKVASALRMHNEIIKNYRDEYREKNTPKENWLVVTVDYHS